MPDKRAHRGRHPEDDKLFATDRLFALHTAVLEHSWLLSRGYAHVSALKLVGDRHRLTARQRTAVMRCACTDAAAGDRQRRRVALDALGSRSLGVDGYNLLITIESDLSGGLILVGRDGCYRDLASIHGTYRKVEETVPAIRLIADYLARFEVPHIDWYLDRPVSNSGRLKTIMAEVLERRAVDGKSDAGWNIQLVASPDATLRAYPGVAATSDSAVLDRCGQWVNLAALIIDALVPTAWTVDLGRNQTSSGSQGPTDAP